MLKAASSFLIYVFSTVLPNTIPLLLYDAQFYITNSMELSPSWETTCCSATQKFPRNVMEPEGSLASSQQPSTGPYPEPNESTLCCPILLF
jgi:hypothetical protein